jgi:hypothetical protein
VEFKVFTAVVIMKRSLLWDITPCIPASCWFLAWFILQPWRWSRYVPPRCRLTFIGLHGVIFQNMWFIKSPQFHQCQRPVMCALALTTQHIITFFIFKLGTSAPIRNLDGYTVRNSDCLLKILLPQFYKNLDRLCTMLIALTEWPRTSGHGDILSAPHTPLGV